MSSLHALLLLGAITSSADCQLLYFSAPWCQPCQTTQPIVARLEAGGWPVRHVDVVREPQVARQYRIEAVPCFILTQQGQEVDRIVGATSYEQLERMFQRARSSTQRSDGGGIAGATTRQTGHSAEPAGGVQRPTRRLPESGTGTATSDPRRAFQSTQLRQLPYAGSSPPAGESAPSGREDTHSRLADRGEQSRASQLALLAAVRLRIDDDRGHSYGSGTIVDVHEDEALVLTCGHIFRDSNGNGPIHVDLFHPQARGPVPGTLIGYDLSRDVALVSIRPGVQVSPASIAGLHERIHPGQQVFSVGCDRGGRPQLHHGIVTAVNRYSGSPNLSVSGQPVDGRSGGGLFTAEGILIGVCNAADPQDNEGLYAAAGAIHEELDQAGLSFVYHPGPMVAQKDEKNEKRRGSGAPAEVEPASANIRPVSQQVLQTDESRSMSSSEVICIVRSREDPTSTSQVIVLDQPSAEFLRLLAREVREGGQVAATSEPSGFPELTPAQDGSASPLAGRPVLRGQMP